MVAVIPFKFNVTAETEVPKSSSYFFDSLTENHPEIYTHIGISNDADKKIRQIIMNEREGYEKKLIDVLGSDSLVPKFLPASFVNAGNSDTAIFEEEYNEDLFMLNGESPSLLFRRSNNLFTLVSKNIEDANRVMSSLIKFCSEIGKVTKDFGLSFNGISSGKEYAVQMLERYGIKKFDSGTPKNDFEAQVMKDVAEITNCLLTNTEISFGSENGEYDILIPYDEDATINIEVTDFQQAKDEMDTQKHGNLKSTLILSTSDKSQLVGAATLIVVRGFPEDIFNQMKSIANSRRVALFNENDYRKGLEAVIGASIINNSLRRRVYRPQRREIIRRGRL